MDQGALFAMIAATSLIAVALMFFIGWTCNASTAEGFQGDVDDEEEFEGSVVEQPDLTKSEQELFEDIKKGKLTDAEVQGMVEDGRLTEELVERFLAHLDAMPGGKKKGDDKQVEGFEADMDMLSALE